MYTHQKTGPSLQFCLLISAISFLTFSLFFFHNSFHLSVTMLICQRQYSSLLLKVRSSLSRYSVFQVEPGLFGLVDRLMTRNSKGWLCTLLRTGPPTSCKLVARTRTSWWPETQKDGCGHCWRPVLQKASNWLRACGKDQLYRMYTLSGGLTDFLLSFWTRMICCGIHCKGWSCCTDNTVTLQPPSASTHCCCCFFVFLLCLYLTLIFS